jgi:hypothetical protein
MTDNVNKNEWVDHGNWNPSPKAFEVYLLREVEMAKEKILNHQEPMLHSTMIVHRAQEELKAEGKLP